MAQLLYEVSFKGTASDTLAAAFEHAELTTDHGVTTVHAGVRDQVKGDYIWYDAISEKYLVTAGKNSDPKGQPTRVRAVIQPKNKTAQGNQPADSGQRLELKGSSAPGASSARN